MAALSTIAKIWKQPVSIDAQMDKEDMIHTHTHTHNGLLVSHKKMKSCHLQQHEGNLKVLC